MRRLSAASAGTSLSLAGRTARVCRTPARRDGEVLVLVFMRRCYDRRAAIGEGEMMGEADILGCVVWSSNPKRCVIRAGAGIQMLQEYRSRKLPGQVGGDHEPLDTVKKPGRNAPAGFCVSGCCAAVTGETYAPSVTVQVRPLRSMSFRLPAGLAARTWASCSCTATSYALAGLL